MGHKDLQGDNYMTAKKLEKAQEQMHEKVKQHAQDLELIPKNGKLKPMCDGVADIDGYLSSNPRIMWILKEPYDKFTLKGKPTGGNWDFTDWFQEKDFWEQVDPGNKRTFRTISTVSYDIHNNTKKCLQNWMNLKFKIH